MPCSLVPAEVPKRGGTITVSNVGAIGDGDFASPILVPGGGVVIMAIGRAKWVWESEQEREWTEGEVEGRCGLECRSPGRRGC